MTSCRHDLTGEECERNLPAHSTRRHYGKIQRTSRRALFSSAPVSAGKGSHPKRRSRRACALFTARRSFSKSSAAMIHVPVVHRANLRIVVCAADAFDGSDRHYFFPPIALLLTRLRRGDCAHPRLTRARRRLPSLWGLGDHLRRPYVAPGLPPMLPAEAVHFVAGAQIIATTSDRFLTFHAARQQEPSRRVRPAPTRVSRSVAQPPRISGEASRWPSWMVPPR